MNYREKTKNGSDPGFEPSITILLRIVKIISEKNVVGRTTLSLKAAMNYSKLTKYLDWLEKRSLIELVILQGKINVRLTQEGKDFALELKKLKSTVYQYY